MKTTEQPSLYNDIDQMSVVDLLKNINNEDHKVPQAVAESIPQIENLVLSILPKVKAGGRVFYAGSGTSGRLGVLDASEILPTYGLSGVFIGVIAGGDKALRHSIEEAEDDTQQCWKDLLAFDINSKDTLIGIAAGGSTPYVIGGVMLAKENGVTTSCITCNKNTPLASKVDFPIELVVDPEFVTGSTRMKSGTAQKLVLNMISTSVMIKTGRVKGNKMVDMKLNNTKLVNRGVQMIIEELHLSESQAKALLLKHGSVRKVIESQRKDD